MNFDLYIFDLDGTLIDTSQDLTNAVNDVLTHYKIETMEKERIIGYVGDGIKRLVERCINGHKVKINEAVSLFKVMYGKRLVETTKPYPGIVKMLRRLEGKVKTVLSNKSYPFTKEILDRLDLSRYFSIIIGGDTFEKKKPHPDAVDYVLKETGILRNASVIIGDGKNDMLAARNAGIASVYVTYGFGRLEQLGDIRPDFIVHSPEELAQILCANEDICEY